MLHCRAFLYPSDLQLELEYWAETGEYDEDELHEVTHVRQRTGNVDLCFVLGLCQWSGLCLGREGLGRVRVEVWVSHNLMESGTHW